MHPKIKAYINATVAPCQSGDTDYWSKYFGIVRFSPPQAIPWRGIGDYIMSQRITISSWDTLYKTWLGFNCSQGRAIMNRPHQYATGFPVLAGKTFQNKHPVLFVILQTTRNVCQGIHCHMLLVYISIGHLLRWICSFLDEQMTADGPGPRHRPPLTYWNSGVEFFLLEVCIKSTLGVVLQNKMVCHEWRIENICPFNTWMFLNYRLQTKKHKCKMIIGYEKQRRL